MSTVQEIESAVSRLSKEQLAAFHAWYVEFHADEWDKQMEADIAAGRLNELADEALRDFRAGRCTEL